MKYCNTIILSVFIKPEEVKEDSAIRDKIKDKIHSLLPLDWEKEKITLKETRAEGFENREITIYELKLLKDKEINVFIKNLCSKLSKEQKDYLISEKNYRLHEEDDFYIRLDKKKLLNDIFEITNSGDCLHIRMNIASFPKSRENALKVINEIFKL